MGDVTMKNVGVFSRPRKIAWFVKESDWLNYENIVKFNCHVVGGYYNIIICLNSVLNIDDNDLEFLESYDPDIVVLAPDMIQELVTLDRINPFSVVSFDNVNEHIYSSESGMFGRENIRVSENDIKDKGFPYKNAMIAVAKDNNIYNKLAFVSCGETVQSAPEPCQRYEEIIDDLGYRKSFLSELALNPDKVTQSNFELNKNILSKNKFPLNNPVDIIDMCIKLQATPINRYSFCNITRNYCNEKKYDSRDDNFVLMMSDEFGVKDASIFWNLRATGRYVSWISFSDFNSYIEPIVTYLDKSLNDIDLDSNFDLYNSNVTISGRKEDLEKLVKVKKKINEKIKNKEKLEVATVKVYDGFKSFDFELPYMNVKNAILIGEELNLNYIHNSFGSYILELKCNDLKFPYNKDIEKLICNEYKYIRVSKENNLLVDLCGIHENIQIKNISLRDIFNEVFKTLGKGEIVISSDGKYQKSFIELSEGLENAVKYLTMSPYKNILESFSVKHKQTGKPGWWANSISRNVYNIFEIYKLLGEDKKDYKFGDMYEKFTHIPPELEELNDKAILEKGIYLTCKECAYTSWYPIDNITQKYTCSRCGKEQVYTAFPLLCLKLKDVIVQGMDKHMEVPLLAINHLKQQSKYKFEWIHDSNFTKGKNENLDILCNIDGLIYIGEAKSCKEIEEKQFRYYEEITSKVAIDGIVFATSQTTWDYNTNNMIEELKNSFKGDIIVLTRKELYGN